MRAEQRGAGYGPQAAAMHTLPHAAHLSSTARGPIQTPDVQLKEYDMNIENSDISHSPHFSDHRTSRWVRWVPLFLILTMPYAQGVTLPIKKIYKQSKESVVLLTTYDENSLPLSLGTGFAIDNGNIIATSLHVILGAKLLKIKYSDGAVCEAVSIVGFDPVHDIALIQSPKTVRALFISTNEPEVGDSVISIGNPKGLENTLSEGIVSGIRNNTDENMYQITAPISPGSSGGPVMSDDGTVLGIATSCMVDGQNLNFAVPAKFITHISRTNIYKFSQLASTPNKSTLSQRDVTQVQIVSSKIEHNTVKASVFNNNTYPVKNVRILIIFHSRFISLYRDYSEAGKLKKTPPGSIAPPKPLHYVIITVDSVILPKLAKRVEKYIPEMSGAGLGWDASYRILDYDIVSSSEFDF